MSSSARKNRNPSPGRAYRAGQERAKNRAAEAEDVPFIERLLAYCSLGIIVISVVAYLSTLIAAWFISREALSESLWPVVVWLSYVGLPLGFVLLFVLLFLSMRRRSKAQRAGRKKK
jgi:RsiW-degrading membrane proteinase PrsW (M82 family)